MANNSIMVRRDFIPPPRLLNKDPKIRFYNGVFQRYQFGKWWQGDEFIEIVGNSDATLDLNDKVLSNGLVLKYPAHSQLNIVIYYSGVMQRLEEGITYTLDRDTGIITFNETGDNNPMTDINLIIFFR